MNKFQILIIRAFLGAGFAVGLSRLFYPDLNSVYVGGLGFSLVGLAYLREYIMDRKAKK